MDRLAGVGGGAGSDKLDGSGLAGGIDKSDIRHDPPRP
jgi:hypothetical protein